MASRPYRKRPGLRKPGSPPPHGSRQEVLACKDFGEKLRRCRPPTDLIALFAALGIPGHRGILYRWEAGMPVQSDHAWLIARALGVSIAWLLNDDDRRPGPVRTVEGVILPGSRRPDSSAVGGASRRLAESGQ